MAGRIVILNGAPRSGKSSIAAAMQATLPGVWVNLGVDATIAALPEKYRPGIGLRPGGERPDLEPLVQQLYAALFDSIAAHSRNGLDIVADLGIHEAHSRPLGIWNEMNRRLAGLPLLRVGVLCPIDTIMARRRQRPLNHEFAPITPDEDGAIPAPILRWQAEVHRDHAYDLAVDTSVLRPAECAAVIGARLPA